MPTYQDNLEQMVARVLAAKPNAQQSEIVRQINGRIRQAIDARIYWSDLLAPRIISFPEPYTTGTVSTSQYSAVVTGSGTAWPTNDVVHTTCPLGVQDFGYQEITPSSMSNIHIDTLLYCDDGGSFPEVVYVVQVSPVSFSAKFLYPHNPNFAITSSSLAGLQFNNGDNYPIFTVLGVVSATSLLLDNQWGGPSISGQKYEIYKTYVSIDPNLKVILDCVDQSVGRKLEIYVPVEKINEVDPQRTATGDPLALVQLYPSPSGSMLYEVWPAVTTARQLAVLCGLQWPELQLATDRPPSFIDPNLFVTGALADSLRIKNIKSVMDQDPWFDPQLAMQYEQMFRIKLEEAKNADEAKAQRSYQQSWDNLYGAGGANFWTRHDPDLNFWNL